MNRTTSFLVYDDPTSRSAACNRICLPAKSRFVRRSRCTESGCVITTSSTELSAASPVRPNGSPVVRTEYTQNVHHMGQRTLYPRLPSPHDYRHVRGSGP